MNRLKTLKNWITQNLACLFLVACFTVIYAITSNDDEIFMKFATRDMDEINGEYYRWLTAIHMHFDFEHIFYNSLALIAIGSLISPIIGKIKTVLIFELCGVLAEMTYSYVVNFPGDCSAGSSGGIFALIATFAILYMRYPEQFKLKWYRLDVLAVAIFFIFANDNIPSFLTHIFGFTAGIIVSFIMVATGIIKAPKEKING